jgi:hypothetical protein
MVMEIGDAVQNSETEIESGADQVSPVSLDPIDRSLRRIGRKFDAIEIRSHSPEGISHRFKVMRLYICNQALAFLRPRFCSDLQSLQPILCAVQHRLEKIGVSHLAAPWY